MVRGQDAPDSPRALRRQATHAALIAAAHVLAETPGADPLDPAAVAAEAGVSRSLFYAHFRSRAAYAEALLAAIHEGGPATVPADGPPRAALLGFFDALAAPLDRHAALARAVVRGSLVPGPVAAARARRRATAVAALAARLPATLPDRAARAAFLMDAFRGLQLAWALGERPGALADAVRADLAYAVDGALAPPPPSPEAP